MILMHMAFTCFNTSPLRANGTNVKATSMIFMVTEQVLVLGPGAGPGPGTDPGAGA